MTINGQSGYINGWPVSEMNRVQTVAAATGTILQDIDEVRVDYTTTAAVTDLEYPDALVASRQKRISIYDVDGNAGTNNITIKTTADAVIAVITEDYGSVTLMSNGTNIDIVA